MSYDSKHDINIEAARLQKFIADFALDFIKYLSQTSVYTADHQVAAEISEELYREFKVLTLNKEEVTFMVSSFVDSNDILIEGILSEPIELSKLLKGVRAEHLVSHFVDYMVRNRLISITIKNAIEYNQFKLFLKALVELPLVEKEAEKGGVDFDTFTLYLLKNKVYDVTVIHRSDIIGVHRAISWPAKTALTKIWKDIKMLSVKYRNLSLQEMIRLRKQIFQNTLKPIHIVKEIAENLDLIEQTLTETQKFDLEKEFIACLSESQTYHLCRALIEEMDAILAKSSTREKSEKVLSDERTIKRLMRKSSERLKQLHTSTSIEIMEEMFRRGGIPESDLPEAVRFKLRTEAVASQFLDNEMAYLSDFKTTSNQKSYLRYLNIFVYILPELIKRKRYDSIGRIVKTLNDHMNEPISPFVGREVYIENTLAKLRSNDVLIAKITSEFKTERKEVREVIGALFLMLGKESVPRLIKLLVETDDAAIRREICSLLEKSGETARVQIIDELKTFKHNWFTVRNLLLILASIGKEEDANKIARYLSHHNPKVREEAMNTVTRLAGKKVEQVLLEKLKDPDTSVVTAAVRLLAEIKSTSQVFLFFLAEVLRHKSGKNTIYPDSITVACSRAITCYANYELPDNPPLEEIILQNFRRRTLREFLFMNIGNLQASREARIAMIEALGSIGTMKSEDVLEGLLKTSDQDLKAAVSAALEKIRARRTAVVVNRPIRF